VKAGEREVWFIGDRSGKPVELRVRIGRATSWWRTQEEANGYFAGCVVADPNAMAGLSVQSEVVKLPSADAVPSKSRRVGRKSATPVAAAAPEVAPPDATPPDGQASLFGFDGTPSPPAYRPEVGDVVPRSEPRPGGVPFSA